jgi:hypothetical protein
MKTSTLNKLTRNLMLSLVVALPVAGIAQAKPGTTKWDESYFTQIDTNKDGRISVEEYEVFMRDAFKKLDKDGNGRLTPNETADTLTVEQFNYLDKNKDGQIEPEEFLEQVIAEFKRHDTDGDGYIKHR